MPNSRSATKKSAAAVHDGNNEVSNDDLNTMMDKKLNEFKPSIITEIIENMKVLIQSEFQNTIQNYKSQLEEVSSTDKPETGKLEPLRKNLHRQDLEKYCEENEQYSRRHCLRIKNMKK